MKQSNVRIVGIPEGVEKNRDLEEIFEKIVPENFPNLAKETSIQVQEAERTPSKVRRIYRTWQASKRWQSIFKALPEKNMQPRTLYPARLSFRIDEEIRTFQDRRKLTKFVTTKPALREILRGVL